MKSGSVSQKINRTPMASLIIMDMFHKVKLLLEQQLDDRRRLILEEGVMGVLYRNIDNFKNL